MRAKTISSKSCLFHRRCFRSTSFNLIRQIRWCYNSANSIHSTHTIRYKKAPIWTSKSLRVSVSLSFIVFHGNFDTNYESLVTNCNVQNGFDIVFVFCWADVDNSHFSPKSNENIWLFDLRTAKLSLDCVEAQLSRWQTTFYFRT